MLLFSLALLLKVKVGVISQLLPYIYNTATIPNQKRAEDFVQDTWHHVLFYPGLLKCSHFISTHRVYYQ